MRDNPARASGPRPVRVPEPRVAGRRDLVVQGEGGGTLTVGCDRDDGVKALRQRLEQALEVPTLDGYSLSYGGHELPLSRGGSGAPSPSPARGPTVRSLPSGMPLLLRADPQPLGRIRSSPDLSEFFKRVSLGGAGAGGGPGRAGEEGEAGEGAAGPADEYDGADEFPVRLRSTTLPAAFQPPAGLSAALRAGATAGGGGAPKRGPERSMEVLGGPFAKAAARKMVLRVRQGVEAGLAPEVVTEGMGGSYVFRDEKGKSAAILKPFDEEPLAPNNPKGFVGRALGEPGLKPTVRVGEAGLREVAAYLLDDGKAGVPTTAIAQVVNPVFNFNGHPASSLSGPKARAKVVSMQEFVAHDFDAGEYGTSMFSVESMHHIGILDIRLFNTDRHSGNILVRKRKGRPLGFGHKRAQSHLDVTRSADYRHEVAALSGSVFGSGTVDLIPIDHGFCLPETLESAYLEWLHWPQASMPFSESTLEYIAGLDAQRDVKLLRQELPTMRIECLRVLEVATTLLQRSAAAGLCLAEIGMLVSSPLVGLQEEPSELEKLCLAAQEEVHTDLAVSTELHAHHLGLRGPAAGRRGSFESERSHEVHKDFGSEELFDMDDISPLVTPLGQSPSRSHASLRHFGSTGAHSVPGSIDEHSLPESSSVNSLDALMSPSTPSPVSPLMAKPGEGGSGSYGKRASEAIQLVRKGSLPHPPSSHGAKMFAQSVVNGASAFLSQYSEMRSTAAKPLAQKPVSCELPSAEVRTLFSGWDSVGWGRFMKALGHQVEGSLMSQHWRHGHKLKTRDGVVLSNFGTSCPERFNHLP